jgi:hypothetical protein
MSRVRGTLVLNSFAFVRKTHGPRAHARILRSLGHEEAAVLGGAIREAAWVPIDPLLLYIEKAKELYAPDEEGYYRRMGRFAGKSDREARAMGVMVRDLATAAQMAAVVWKQFFDKGDLEVAERTESGARLRIRGFPAHPVLCERIVGSLEGLLAAAAPALIVEKAGCLLEGDPACEYVLRFRE